jgi:hypothetical protein
MIIAAKSYGADYVLAGGLTIFGNGPSDSKTLYYRFLHHHYPDLLPAYEKMYGNNFYASWKYQDELKQKITRLCKKYENTE